MTERQDSFTALIIMLAFLSLAYMQFIWQLDDARRFDIRAQQAKLTEQIKAMNVLLQEIQSAQNTPIIIEVPSPQQAKAKPKPRVNANTGKPPASVAGSDLPQKGK